MQIENSFQVPVPVEQAWDLFTDVQRIAPCMPGATITEQLDDGRFRGEAQVQLGPVTLRFAGQAEFVERDEATRTVKLVASGRDQTGRGTADATITTKLVGQGEVTDVRLVTDLHLSGAVAQFGRQGIVNDVSSALVGQFADCLSQRLVGPTPTTGADAPSPAAGRADSRSPSISALALARQVLVGALRRARDRVRTLLARR